MKRVNTIQLEIDSDKVAEFYCSLLNYKTSEEPDPKDLKMMADAINFDKDSLMEIFIPSEFEEENIDNRLKSIHKYLLQLKNDSIDYFQVSKNNFEEFKSTSFCKDLYDLFKMKEISKKWIGKGECAEVKSVIAAYSITMYYFIYCFADDVNASLKETSKNKLSPIDFQDQPFNVNISENGNFYSIRGENTHEEIEFYIEKKGQIIKANLNSKTLEKKFLDKTSYFLFLKSEKKAIRIDGKEDNLQVIHYENVEENNNKLDLENAKTINTFIVLKADIEKAVTISDDGNYIYKPNDALSKKLIRKTTSPTINNDNEPIVNHGKKNLKIDTESFASIYNPINELITFFLKDIEKKKEKNEARDKLVPLVYEILENHYNDFTPHIYYTITGYICSELELLNTEVQHDNSENTQPYRKYLKDTVYHIIKKTH